MAMIADWIFHPFRHLESGHALMHHAAVGAPSTASPTVRRIIFLRVGNNGELGGGFSSLFAIGASRVPQFLVDVDMHTLTLLGVKDLGPGTGWGRVPTPMF
jgi:hypothetical protein